MTHPSLQEEAAMMHHVMSQLRRYQEDRAAAAGQKWKLPPTGQPVAPFSNATNTRGRAVIRPTDDSECGGRWGEGRERERERGVFNWELDQSRRLAA